MPLYVGDFLADTMHLGATETGIYVRLIMHCWQHGTIPRDDRKLALIAHCDTRLFHQYKKTVLDFFEESPVTAQQNSDVVDASTMQHKRVSTELLRAEKISNKRKGAAEQMHKNRAANAVQMHTQPQPQSQNKESKKESCSNEFELFWKAYPRRVGKKVAEKALAKALRETSIETITEALARQTPSWTDPKFIPHPSTWLNAGRWADEVGYVNGAPPKVSTLEEIEAGREWYRRKQQRAAE
jgi:uncharacterized protein YdaU (DUF1376 family)